jgi:hypothetical protein
MTVSADANAGPTATNAAAAIQKTVGDTCPIIVTDVSATDSASKAFLSAGKSLAASP